MTEIAEGFHASEPIHFFAVSRPQKDTLKKLEEYHLTRFDVEHVIRPVMDHVVATSPVRLVRFAEGVNYDWACRVALTFLDDNGIAIGKLNGTPVLFSASLPQEGLKLLYDELKHAYDDERDNPRLTSDVYPAAQNNIESQAKRLADSLKGEVRILDLASAEGGVAPYIFKSNLKGTYLKVDNDKTSLAVLNDLCRENKGLEFIGIQTSVERIKDAKFQARLQESLGGKATALVCSHALHQLKGSFFDTTVEQWMGYFSELLEPGGRLLVADFFYNEKAGDDDVQRAIEQLYKRVEDHPELRVEDFHFGGRDEYFSPTEIRQILEKNGFKDIREASSPVLDGSAHEFFVLQAHL